MNEDQQNFESLRRLLALKRHETPPAGYFNRFSRDVMARIRADEASDAAGLFDRIPWLVKWLQSLEAKPLFAGGFATGLCLLLILGAVMAQRPETVTETFLQPSPAREDTMVAVAAPMAPTGFEQSPGQIMIDSSTNPIINFQNSPSPFGQMPVSALPASFPLGN